jgi:protein TonB
MSYAMADQFEFKGARRNRVVAVGAIVLLHVALIAALRSGLISYAIPASPQQVTSVSLIADAAPRPKLQALPPMKVHLTVPPPVTVALPQQVSVVSITQEPPAASAPATPTVTAAVNAPAPAQLRTISSGVEYVHAPRPDYPPMSRRMGEEGRVVLRVLVNERGQPEQVEIIKSSGSGRLDEAARQAALRALFKPHIEEGRPIPVYAMVPIAFRLS